MTEMDETVALVAHLEAVLTRLETGNSEFPGGCCACLQDVATAGHLPSCYIAQALGEVRKWRAKSPGS